MFWLFSLLFVPIAVASEYVNAEHQFRFSFNETQWEVVKQELPKAGAEVDREMAQKTLATIQAKSADEKYRPRFSVVVDEMKKFEAEPDPRLAYDRHAVEFLKGQRFTIISTNPRLLSGGKLKATEITAYQRDFGLTFKQIIFIREKKAYLLTAAARTKNFENYDRDLLSMIDSFTFVERPAKN
jgi:hypothetical protein